MVNVVLAFKTKTWHFQPRQDILIRNPYSLD